MRILIWGAGGHGKVVGELARSLGHRVAGFIDAAPERRGEIVDAAGSAVVATEAELWLMLAAGDVLPADAEHVVPAFGDNSLRLRAVTGLGPHIAPPVAHPSSIVSPSAHIGLGTVVLAGAVVNASAVIGRGVIINTASIVEHDVRVEDGAHVSPGAVLTGGVFVGECAWIGASAVVLPGVRIGSGAIVGAGAVAHRDVPAGSTVVGNPARAVVTRMRT